MARRGNFDVLGKYAWCIPSGGDIVILALLLVVGALIGSGVVLIASLCVGAENAAAFTAQYTTLISYPIMFIPPMMWAAGKSRRNRMEYKGLALDNANVAPLGWFKCVVMVMAATLAAGLVGDFTTSVLPPMPEWLENALKGLTTGNFWINFICVSLFAPFFEEWLCRGMVERGLLGRGMKPVWAIVISSLFFALIHLNPWQAIPAFLLGCLFGYVYYKTGSLKLTMLMHFTNNTFALVIGHVESLKDAETWMDVLGPGYWYCAIAGLLLLVLVVKAFAKIPLERPAGGFAVLPSAFED
ncbi:MAG: CPBP family intramembrane metalloprotease [Bacteroidales bacterium]|nr:CPBP family intramembrane metalloprotease [Bacteroidales bacterium]